jgi:hypothetical protein
MGRGQKFYLLGLTQKPSHLNCHQHPSHHHHRQRRQLDLSLPQHHQCPQRKMYQHCQRFRWF